MESGFLKTRHKVVQGNFALLEVTIHSGFPFVSRDQTFFSWRPSAKKKVVIALTRVIRMPVILKTF